MEPPRGIEPPRAGFVVQPPDPLARAIGATDGIRTRFLGVKAQASYPVDDRGVMVGTKGIEPQTSAVSRRRTSNMLCSRNGAP